MNANEMEVLESLAEKCDEGRVEKTGWEQNTDECPIKVVSVNGIYNAVIFNERIIMSKFDRTNKCTNYLLKIRQ